MSTWLETMRTALAAVTAEQVRAATPNNPTEEGDKVIGNLDMGLQRLYALACDFGMKSEIAEQAAKTAGKAGDKEVRQQQLRELAIMHEQAETVFHMFWTSVRSAFGLWSAPTVAIRTDWQVVVTEAQSCMEVHVVSIDLVDLIRARGGRGSGG